MNSISIQKKYAVSSLLYIFCFLLSLNVAVAQTYLIKNVTLIPMDKVGSVANQSVLIENGKIKQIGKNIKISSGTETIDGTGKYLMPGLMDMHTHFFYEQGNHVNTCVEEVKLMLTNGLTTVRIEGGHPEYLEAREKVAKKEWVGPQLLVVSIPFVGKGEVGNPFEYLCETPEAAVNGVRRFKKEGYNAIKVITLKPEVYDAVIRTAKEENILVTGHVGPLVKLPKALAAKQQIEHMDQFIDMLLPDTSNNHGQSVSDMNLWSKKAWATVPYLDESIIGDLVKKVKDAGVYVTPTNYFFYSFFATGIDEAKVNQSLDFQYVPSAIKEYAWKVRKHYWTNPPPEESRKKYIGIRNKMIFEMWKAGVPLLAGSDSPQWFIVAGFAIHDELENLVNAGLTPYAALQTATINPATYLGLIKQTGTITVGKQADLVLLDKNPLEDIKNTRAINSVFVDGTLYNGEMRSQLLEEAKVLGK